MTTAIPHLLSPEQRESVYELFLSASEQPPEDRAAFIERACPSDDAVRREVLRLLANSERTEELFLEPAMAEAARWLKDEPLKPGRQIGRYRILKLLGEGGMGRVYHARDDIGKEVAIKLAMADDADWLERLEREARTQARLNHPNIAAIYSREARDGLRFLVLEYVPGQTLAARLQESGRLETDEAIRIFSGIADALAFLHQSGRIHRDLKPSNVMITPEGVPKLLDFGIAKRLVQETEPSSHGLSAGTNDQATTRSDSMNEWRTQWGGTPGTLLYMSPEQLRGAASSDGAFGRQEPDERVDWWAFGLMFYEALTGRRPFERETTEETRAAILAAAPDWMLLPRRTPKLLRELLQRCLEKDRQTRLRSAEEVKRLLNAALPDPLWRLLKNKFGRPAFRWVPAGLAMLIVIAALFFLKDKSGANSTPKRPSVTVIFKEEANDVTDKANACGENRNSRVLAQLLAQRLKAIPDLVVRSSDRTLENLSAAIGLTRLSPALDVDWTVCVTARCSGQQLAISYEIANRRGYVTARGERREIAGLHDAVLGAIGVKPSAEPSQDDSKYFAALDLMAQYGNGRALDDAIVLLEKLRLDDPASARTNSALAKAHYLALNLARSRGAENDAGEIRRKIREYCELSTRNAEDEETVEAKINCGYIFSMLGQPETAIANLESIQNRRANDPEFHLTLAEAYENLAKEHSAKAVAAEPEFGKAEQHFLNALALRKDWGTLMDVGAFYFARTRYEKAVEYWEGAAKLLNADPRSAGNLCAGYLYSERFEEALPRCLLAVREDGPESRLNYGMTLLLMGKCDEARAEFEQGRDAAAQSAELLPDLLGGYADACRCASAPACRPERDYLRAVALLRQQYTVFEDDGALAGAFSLAAEWLAKAGRKAEARQELNRISDQFACQADCLISSIKVYHLTGDREQALKLVAKSVNHAERRKILFNLKHDPELKDLRDDPHYQRLIAALSPSAR